MSGKELWWNRAPAGQRMWFAAAAFLGWLALLSWAASDFWGFVHSSLFAWLIVVGWPVALPWFAYQFIRARRDLRGGEVRDGAGRLAERHTAS